MQIRVSLLSDKILLPSEMVKNISYGCLFILLSKKSIKISSKCYYYAENMRNSIKTLFSDGEEHFNILKEEIFDSIYETYEDLSQINSYQKLKNVLEMVIKATLNSSILLNIKGLITTKEKKGICHILVNEGRIRSW